MRKWILFAGTILLVTAFSVCAIGSSKISIEGTVKIPNSLGFGSADDGVLVQFVSVEIVAPTRPRRWPPPQLSGILTVDPSQDESRRNLYQTPELRFLVIAASGGPNESNPSAHDRPALRMSSIIFMLAGQQIHLPT